MKGWLAAIFWALAQAVVASEWDALREPGAVAIMRHALAPGTGDPAEFTLDACDTQRNLDASGRAQAQAIGAAMRAEGIVFDAIWTSQWCRCRDTAVLLELGAVRDEPLLNSFFRNRADGPVQTDTLRSLLAESDQRVLMVTHQVNITALTGVFPGSGEVIVIRVAEDGAVTVLDQILIAP